jgi:hypothetical protein
VTTLASAVHFVLYQYATFSEQIVLRDSNEVARDLTGYTALMHVRREVDDESPIFTCTTVDGSIVLGGAAGTVVFSVPFTDTDLTIDDDGETWFYDLLLTNPATTPDTVEKPIFGTISAFRGITRPA